jgi:two-component system cell cycle sensor histidine kinase PleC
MNQKSMLKPEMLIPRLGDLLIDKGLITHGALDFCLKKQEKMKAKGEVKQIGQVLVQEGLIDDDTLSGVITEQIVELRNALISANQKLEDRVRERTAELEVALKKLEEMNRTKSSIISNLSHELFTPLNHMKGYLELLNSESLGCLSKEQAEAIKVIQKSYNKLEQMISDLLQFSESSHGNQYVKKDPISVMDFLTSPLNNATRLAEERKIKLEVTISKPTPRVMGDQEKLMAVINQLLDNALKFTPANGTVIVKVETHQEEVLISVADTGIGIPQERLDEVFEPFHQLDESAARRYGGTGLGLSIVKRILDEHNARYDLASKVNQGSTFEFHLPVVE